MKNMMKRSYVIICSLFFILISSCQGQAYNSDTCLKYLKKARVAFTSYQLSEHINKNTDLDSLLYDVEYAMQCPKTRMGAIELKISLLMILKKYKQGYQFVDSLENKDFTLAYKREMWIDYFHAYECESHLDTINRNRYFDSIILNLQNYIKGERFPKNKINEEAYYDLFLAKSKVLTKKEIAAELNLLEQQHPNSKDFFDALESNFEYNGVKSINAH